MRKKLAGWQAARCCESNIQVRLSGLLTRTRSAALCAMSVHSPQSGKPKEKGQRRKWNWSKNKQEPEKQKGRPQGRGARGKPSEIGRIDLQGRAIRAQSFQNQRQPRPCGPNWRKPPAPQRRAVGKRMWGYPSAAMPFRSRRSRSRRAGPLGRFKPCSHC